MSSAEASIPLRPRYTDRAIAEMVHACPKLASLQCINRALAGLVNSDQSYNEQIAEIIRQDPSLTARLLRMVNSVYFGLSAKVNNIEEAVFYLGLRQIRELSLATPVIEDMEKMGKGLPNLPWRDMWKHSIGSAILTRELLSLTSFLIDDDTDYIVGLLHNVGKVVMATEFPEEFAILIDATYESREHVCAAERALIGWDHTQIGAHYLEHHKLAEEIFTAVRHNVEPELAGKHVFFAAAVQISDEMVRSAGFPGGFEKIEPVSKTAWRTLSGWQILFEEDEHAAEIAKDAMAGILMQLPSTLKRFL